MSRRKALLAALALCGGLAVSTAPLSSATPSIPPPPQPCGTHVLVTQSDGNYYLWLPNPTGQTCWISVEVPGNIQKPGTAASPPIDGCPAEPLAYESNGHDYVLTPDPSGQQTCGHYTELPVTVPPTF